MADADIPILTRSDTQKNENEFLKFDRVRYKKEYRQKMIVTSQLRQKFDPTFDIAKNVEIMQGQIKMLIQHLRKVSPQSSDLPTQEGVPEEDSEAREEFFEKAGKDISPRRDALLRAGATGAGAVYMGEKLDEMGETMEKFQEQEKEGFLEKLLGGGGLLGGLLGRGGGGLLGKLFGGGKGLMRMGGLAAFAALKWDDIAESIGMFQEGDIMKGISTLLLGNIDKVTGENMLGGIAKQGGAWAGMGMAIGGPVGALVGFVAGALGKTIQSAVKATRDAYENEWDKNLPEIMAAKKDALKQAEGFREKFRALSDLAFTSIGTTFAGAKRTAEEYEGEGRSKVLGWIFGAVDQMAEKAAIRMFGDDPEKMKAWKEGQKIMKQRRKEVLDKIKGFANKAGDYARDFFETIRKEGLGGIKNTQLVRDLATKWLETREKLAEGWEKMKEAARESWDGFKERVKGGWEQAKANWQWMRDEIKEKGIVQFTKERMQEFRDKLENFADSMRKVISSIVDWFQEAGQKVGDFFVNAFGGDIKMLERWESQMEEGKLEREQAFTKILGERSLQKSFARDVLNLEGKEWKDVRTDAGNLKSQFQEQFFDYLRDEYGFAGFTDSELRTMFGQRRMGQIKVDDAIIKPNGEIIHTSPSDTIIATKAQVQPFDDTAMRGMMQSTGNQTIQVENQMLEVLRSIDSKTGQGNTGGAIVNNFTNRYSPQFMMERLRAVEVQ